MPHKILIVDDASFVREILKTISLKQGWTVIGEASDGEEAVEMSKRLIPDYIIMDIVMPKINGLEAGKLILKNNPLISIIGLSTIDQEEILLKAIDIGFISYITKPFENRTVIRAVNEAIQMKARKSG